MVLSRWGRKAQAFVFKGCPHSPRQFGPYHTYCTRFLSRRKPRLRDGDSKQRISEYYIPFLHDGQEPSGKKAARGIDARTYPWGMAGNVAEWVNELIQCRFAGIV
jgi:hypothetical protein